MKFHYDDGGGFMSFSAVNASVAAAILTNYLRKFFKIRISDSPLLSRFITNP